MVVCSHLNVLPGAVALARICWLCLPASPAPRGDHGLVCLPAPAGMSWNRRGCAFDFTLDLHPAAFQVRVWLIYNGRQPASACAAACLAKRLAGWASADQRHQQISGISRSAAAAAAAASASTFLNGWSCLAALLCCPTHWPPRCLQTARSGCLAGRARSYQWQLAAASAK